MFNGAKIANSIQLDLIQHYYKSGIADKYPGVKFTHIKNDETWIGTQYRLYELSINYNYNISTNINKKIIQRDNLTFIIRITRNGFKIISSKHNDSYNITLRKYRKMLDWVYWMGPIDVDRTNFHEEVVRSIYKCILCLYVLEKPTSENKFINMFESHIDKSKTAQNPNSMMYKLLHTDEIYNKLISTNKVIKFCNYVNFPESIRTNNGSMIDLKDRIQNQDGEINTNMIDAIANLAKLDVI